MEPEGILFGLGQQSSSEIFMYLFCCGAVVSVPTFPLNHKCLGTAYLDKWHGKLNHRYLFTLKFTLKSIITNKMTLIMPTNIVFLAKKIWMDAV